MKKIRALVLTILLAISVSATVFADDSFNPDDELGHVVTLANKNFIVSITQWNPEEIMYVDRDTKIVFHNGKKVIKAGDIIKYSYRDDDALNSYLDEAHVYNFDINLLY